MLGYYQDKTCWVSSQICAVLPTIIRMASLLNFASCILLGLLLYCFAAYCVRYEEYLAGYSVVIIGDSIWMFFLLISSLVLLLIWFCFCVVKPLEFGFQPSQWANHVYLGLMLDLSSSTPFVQALSLRNSCVIFTEQHELCSFILWKLVPLVYRFVVTQCCPLGSACLVLQLLTLADLTLICFPAWVRLLCLRPFLCYPTLFDWSIRMVHSPLMVYVNLVDFHIWYSDMLIQFTWRLWFVLVFRLSFAATILRF